MIRITNYNCSSISSNENRSDSEEKDQKKVKLMLI